MLRFKECQTPYYLDESKGENYYLKLRDPKNLVLEPLINFDDVLEEKLTY